jgi:hypothetical protein
MRTLRWGCTFLAACVELADGRLMLNMRDHPPKPENFRMVAISADGGETLSAAYADRALIEPPAQASILRVSRASPQGLLFERGERSPYERISYARFTLEWLSEGKDR